MAPEDAVHHARIRISPDKLVAELHVDAEAPAGAIDEMLILSMLAEIDIKVTPPVRAAVAKAAAVLTSPRQSATTLTIAEGIAPVHGTMGQLIFKPEYDPANLQAAMNAAPESSAGSVDHYNKQCFKMVPPGTHFATLQPAGEAMDGQDVHGQTIAAVPGKSVDVKPDDSLLISADGKIVSTRNGVVDWKPPSLRVVQTLNLPGNVDFATGHVDFPGSVVVGRSVRDKFRVACTGDLVVQGLVEGAILKTGRDAHLRAGMAAKESGTLEVARDCQAKYLNNAMVTVGRDLVIEKELVNSQVTVGRSFKAPTAGITGGCLICAGAVEVSDLGSEIGVLTEVRLAALPSLQQLIAQAEQLLPRLQKQLDKIDGQLQQFKQFKGKLPAADAERLCELEFERRAVIDKHSPLTQKLDRLRETLAKRTKVDLLVHGMVYPKVLLHTGLYTVDFTKALKGPVRFLATGRGEPIMCNKDGTPVDAPLHAYARVRKVDGLGASAKAA